MKKNTVDAFFALVRAGLWENEVRLSAFGTSDFEAIMKLGMEQSVSGLVTAGLDHVSDVKIDKDNSMPFLKEIVRREVHNSAMNDFVAKLFNQMNDKGIKAVLVKGQGVAQCYERPTWRAAGDVDLFLDEENYQKAKEFLIPFVDYSDPEDAAKKHLAMKVASFDVELHGAMHTDVSARIDAVVDEVQRDIFENRGVRYWDNGGISIPLPSPDNDVIIIFTHFIGHFYVGGIGLRQICDWCRLLWTYKDKINRDLLGKRLNDMELMPEWQAFATFAVEFLGMPAEAMPFYVDSAKNKRRALRIRSLVLRTGNFGHNKDESYRWRHSRLVGNIITFFHRFGEFVRLSTIFPSNAPRFFVFYMKSRIR